MCLTQHVSLQTSDVSAQPGEQQRPHYHFAEHRGCIQTHVDCSVATDKEATILLVNRLHVPLAWGVDSGALIVSRMSIHVQGPTKQPKHQHPFPIFITVLFYSNPGVQEKEITSLSMGPDPQRCSELTHCCCKYLSSSSISSLWLNCFLLSLWHTHHTGQSELSKPSQLFWLILVSLRSGSVPLILSNARLDLTQVQKPFSSQLVPIMTKLFATFYSPSRRGLGKALGKER